MKTTLVGILLIGLIASLPSCTSKQGENKSKADSTIAASSEEYYTCPMHPFIRSDRPGACPICGMALVKKTGPQNLSANQLSLLKDVSLSPTQIVLANINTASVERRTLEREITSVGVVSVAEPLQATIAARFSGRVGKLYADYTGLVVRKDQPLFELYSPEIISATQDYILALNGLRSAKDDSASQNASAQDRLVVASRARLKTHFGMTEGQLSQIERTREIPTSIRFDSPIHGTVLTKEVQEGQYVEEGMVLYKLADLSKVWINLDVYEQNLRYVKMGQDVVIITDAYPDEEFHGRVTFVDPAMNSETRTVRVRTESENQNFNLKPNMFVEARIKVPVKDALVVPTSAVIATGKRTVVWVEVKSNTFEPRNVVVGASTDQDTEILDGLHEGEVIAVSGGFLIDSESQLSQTSDQDIAPKVTGHQHGPASGADVKSEPSKYLRSLKNSGGIVDVHILVHGSYDPDIIHAKLGKTLRLHFYRDEDSECSSEVLFKEFNIRTFLPPHDTTLIVITPTKVGTIDFECGMGMISGKIIVED